MVAIAGRGVEGLEPYFYVESIRLGVGLVMYIYIGRTEGEGAIKSNQSRGLQGAIGYKSSFWVLFA